MSEEKTQGKEAQKLPSDTLTIEINGEKLTTKFPTNGQLMDMESMKIRMSGGNYNEIMNGGTSALISIATIDTIVAFRVLFTDYCDKKLTVPFSQLSPIDTRPYIAIYLKEIKPWLSSWFSVLSSFPEEQAEQK